MVVAGWVGERPCRSRIARLFGKGMRARQALGQMDPFGCILHFSETGVL